MSKSDPLPKRKSIDREARKNVLARVQPKESTTIGSALRELAGCEESTLSVELHKLSGKKGGSRSPSHDDTTD